MLSLAKFRPRVGEREKATAMGATKLRKRERERES